MIGRQRVGGFDEKGGVCQVTGKAIGVFGGRLCGTLQFLWQRREGGGRLYALEDVFKLAGIAGELFGLLAEAQLDRAEPGNVRSSVKVIANPAGERRQGGPQVLPGTGEGLPCCLDDEAGIECLCLGGMAQRVLSLLMLGLQRDRLVPIAPVGAGLGLQCGTVRGGGLGYIGGQGGAQVPGKGEGRVSRKHNSAGRGFHHLPERLEALARQRHQPGPDRRPGGLGVCALMLCAELGRPFVEQRQMHRVGKARELLEAEFARFQLPEQSLGEGEDRVGQRVGIDARGFLPEEVLCPIKAQSG